MPDNAASIDDGGWWRWLRRGTIALAIGLLILSVVYMAIRVRSIYTLQAELIRVRADVAHLQQHQTSRLDLAAARLDDLERVLFGEVVAKLEKPAPPRPGPAELWQKNRDVNFSTRISAAEFRLLTIENRIQRIEREIQQWRRP